MSRETIQWLNENTLIGFTEKRGSAWHGRMGDDNHYVGPVPVEDVRKRLFDWTAEERPVFVGTHNSVNADAYHYVAIPGRKAIVRSDTGAVLGVFTDSYQPHDYNEWLVTNVENLLDSDLQIGTAGLLQGGGKAWVQVEKPDTMEFAGGVLARPFLLAAGSMNGTLSSTYGLSVTNSVCDNTMEIAMGESGGFQMKIRHSAKSLDQIQTVRDALGIIHTAADDFGRQVEALLETKISDRDFDKLLESEIPGEEPATVFDQHFHRKLSQWKKVQAKRDHVRDMYRFDVRCAPWTGTAYGAWQTFNTFQQHESSVRKGTNRVERNARWMVEGKQAKSDARIIRKVLELAS